MNYKHFIGVFAAALCSMMIISNSQAFFDSNSQSEHKKVIVRETLGNEKLPPSNVIAGSGIAQSSDFLKKYGHNWNFKWDRITLTPVIASGEGIPMLGEDMNLWDVESLTRYFVDENDALFGVTSDELLLDMNSSKQLGPYGEMWFLHFVQRFNGIPVLNSNIFFRYKIGRLIQFGSESYPNIFLNTKPSISPEDALETAKEAVSFADGANRLEAYGELYVYPVKRNSFFEYRLVYKNVFFISNPYGEWVVYVDAHDGSLIEKYTNTYFFQGRLFGHVHPRLATDEYVEVPLENVYVNISGIKDSITDESGIFGARVSNVRKISMNIAGPLAYARSCDTVFMEATSEHTRCDSTETKVVFVGNENWDYYDSVPFSLDDSNTASSERDSFFFVNRAVKWASRFIDIDWFRKPLEINVNISEMVERSLWEEKREQMSCNAFWDGRSLNFFVGNDICNYAANIADIVIHEWGHGLDQNTGGIEDPAFSEGIADISAFIMTGDHRIGLSFFKKPNAQTGGTYIRNVAEDKVYPKDKHNDPHIESLIISGAWWDLRESLIERYGFEEGNDRTSYLFLNHLFTAKKYLDSYEAALAVDDDNGNMTDGTPNYDLIRQAFLIHGLVK